jgi:4-hydroxy-2-oxoheptanedioate aldolase
VTELRPNHAKRKLLAGEPTLAPMLGVNSLPDNDTLELFGTLGLIDIAWIEMEHGPTVWSQLGDIARACDITGVTSIVRVDRNEPAVVGRTLDRGVQGLLVPHVNTKAEAERIVEGALYAPMGRRGMARVRHSYGVDDYYAKANDEILIIATVEDVVAVENLSDILSVPGIDCIFVAPVDLGQTMGAQYTGKAFDPDVQEVVQSTLREIVAAGRACGTLVGEQNFDACLEIGARFLRFSVEPFIVRGIEEVRARAHAAAGVA